MEVRLSAEAIEDYRHLPLVIRARVTAILEKLQHWPRVSGAKPLRKKWKGHYRIRTGDWRIILKPTNEILWIVRIDNRRDIYGD
jgi:mRNA-degrading endonuclease RelE of RelBE toxin-antitoxin system